MLNKVMEDLRFYEEQLEILKEKKHEYKIKHNRQQKIIDDVIDTGFEIANVKDYAKELEQIEIDLKLCKSCARRLRNILECYDLI